MPRSSLASGRTESDTCVAFAACNRQPLWRPKRFTAWSSRRQSLLKQ
jgi:hypothetical protein